MINHVEHVETGSSSYELELENGIVNFPLRTQRLCVKKLLTTNC